jgi:hypothetical protein
MFEGWRGKRVLLFMTVGYLRVWELLFRPVFAMPYYRFTYSIDTIHAMYCWRQV